MDFVCDAPNNNTWFRITSEAEAAAESKLMNHAVEKHYRQFRDAAIATYAPSPSLPYIERDIGLMDHIRRSMPIFVTLRDADGGGLATAMLPPAGVRAERFRSIVVGPSNTDPFPAHAAAIAMLAKHFKVAIDPAICYPYRRG